MASSRSSSPSSSGNDSYQTGPQVGRVRGWWDALSLLVGVVAAFTAGIGFAFGFHSVG
ncbi:hypothetical protein [Gordonia oryzae]|uniref:hypothetical protein n=1 Tax=Gordonia oryzae TaxID=2487349 RepID=UPI003F84B08C